jgi:hypothetical protein
MNMNARNSLLSRMAVSSMGFAVRFWPESSRDWGQAVLAEMGQISEPAEVLHWAAGGILLFGRAVMAHFFEWIKLPAGSGFSRTSTAGSNGPQFPKHSRLATALVLLAALALFLLPIGRETVRTVKSSWSGFQPSANDERDLEKIAAKAAQEKDARQLAFVAVIYPDTKKAYAYADQAVELDPSLAWIYSNRWYYYRSQDAPQRTERAETLQKLDPENGFVHLVSAYAIAEPMIEEQILDRRGLTAQTAAEVLGKNNAWKSEMEKGFAAQKYDSYFDRNLELVQEGWRKNPSLSGALIGIGLWQHSVGSATEILSYADIRRDEAVEAGTAGNVKEAELILNGMRDFGRRMSSGSTIPFEKELGNGVTQRGLMGFEKLYAATGQAEEEKKIQAQLGELEMVKKAQVDTYLNWRGEVERNFHWTALVVQIAAVLCVLFAIAVVLSLLVLEVCFAFSWKISKSERWIACRVADYGPVLLLVASVALLVSFRPLAEAFEQFRSTQQPGYDGLGLFWQVFALSDANFFEYFYVPYHRWLVGTVALAALAAIVLVRGLARGKTVAAAR